VDLVPSTASRRCILLFARTAKEEACAKRLSRARGLFALARRRVLAAARSLGIDLLVAGPGGALLQRGGSFAERLENAFADARALGYEAIVAVPTDVPRLGRRQLAAAFRRLAAAPVVLGPSPDGGAYLIGCRNDPAGLFAGVRWQTSRTFADLAANAGSPAVLDPLEDVDRWADLPSLAAGTDREIAGLVTVILRGPAAARDFRRPVPILLADPLFDRPPPPARLPAWTH
jgi:glycosyltransferase A (GT-A) superfamily protein (DUF2064 family)